MAINWTIDEQGILTIEGSGRLPDFRGGDDPDPYWRNSFGAVRKAVIGDGITEIGTRSFENFADLTEVVLPPSLNRIRAYAFRNCTALGRIVAEGREFRYVYDKSADQEGSDRPIIFGISSFSGTPWAKDYFNGSYVRDDILYICFEGQGEIRIPEGIRRICGFAFADVRAEKLILPETLGKIDDHAFLGASFAKIVMPFNMVEFPTNCANGELRDSLGIPKKVRKSGKAAVPDLYELVTGTGKKYGMYRKLAVHEKRAALDEKGVKRELWGREAVDVGGSVVRRLRRGGDLVGVTFKEDRADAVRTYRMGSEDKVIREYLTHPCLDDGSIGFRDGFCTERGNEFFRNMFSDKDAKELIRRGVIRIAPDGIREEWFWIPKDEGHEVSIWDVCRTILEILSKADPSIRIPDR